MDLFFRKSGAGDPVIILHGLYGSSDNWYSVARELASENTVYLVDQRNHGNSPHHPDHTYEVMREDLKAFMHRHGLSKSIIIGHSMGGKAALAFGIKYPEKVRKMIVIDISPLDYGKHHNSTENTIHERIIRAMLSIIPDVLASREEADKLLQKSIAPPAIRQFLLKNLKRNPEGKFYWGLNLQAIADNLPAIFASVIPDNMDSQQIIPRFPLLFIKGEYSGYIKKHDEKAIHDFFPWARLVTIQGAGHWVHAEQPEALLNAVHGFIHTAS
jgi:esterase